MPYSDPQKQREAQRRSWKKRMLDAKFREEQKLRKQTWLEDPANKRKNAQATARHRRKHDPDWMKKRVAQLRKEIAEREEMIARYEAVMRDARILDS